MHISEVDKHQWNVKHPLKTETNRLERFQGEEQELHLNVLKVGLKDPKEQEILVTCSNPPYITELSKSQFFTLTGTLLSSHPNNQGFILQIEGELNIKGLSIRKKIPIISEEEKEKRRERMRQYHQTKQEK